MNTFKFNNLDNLIKITNEIYLIRNVYTELIGELDISNYNNITIIIPETIRSFNCHFINSIGKNNNFTIKFEHISFKNCYFESCCFSNVYNFKFNEDKNENKILILPKYAIDNRYNIIIESDDEIIKSKLEEQYLQKLNELQNNLSIIQCFINMSILEYNKKKQNEKDKMDKDEIINQNQLQNQNINQNINQLQNQNENINQNINQNQKIEIQMFKYKIENIEKLNNEISKTFTHSFV